MQEYYSRLLAPSAVLVGAVAEGTAGTAVVNLEAVHEGQKVTGGRSGQGRATQTYWHFLS